jgi:hypothetical protein
LSEFSKWIGRLHESQSNLNKEQNLISITIPGDRLSGKLTSLHPSFGFIDTGSERLYFHKAQWHGKENFSQLKEDTLVIYEEGSNEQGKCAINVLLPCEMSEDPEAEWLLADSRGKLDFELSGDEVDDRL